MIETEKKIKVPDFKNIREKLIANKAKFLGVTKEINHLLETKDGKFQKNKVIFRVRINSGTNTGQLTIKMPAPDASAKKEKIKSMAEVVNENIKNPKKLLKTLELSGLKTNFIYRKKREDWIIGKTLICLDELPVIGKFVEIEGTIKTIKILAKKLGLERYPSYTTSYADICKKSGK
jgi:predicted adenylyl cyclase CyaB